MAKRRNRKRRSCGLTSFPRTRPEWSDSCCAESWFLRTFTSQLPSSYTIILLSRFPFPRVLGLGCNIACFLASSSQKMAVVVVVVGCSKNSNIALRGLHHDDYNAVPSQHSNQSGATLRGISQKEQQTATIVETTRTTSQIRATAQHRQPQLKTAAPAATLATRGKTKLTNLQPQIAIIKKNAAKGQIVQPLWAGKSRCICFSAFGPLCFCQVPMEHRQEITRIGTTKGCDRLYYSNPEVVRDEKGL